MATLGAMFANTGVKKAETPPQRVTKWIHYTKLKDNAAQYCSGFMEMKMTKMTEDRVKNILRFRNSKLKNIHQKMISL